MPTDDEYEKLRARVREAEKTVRDMNERDVAQGRREPKTRREWEIKAGVREPPKPIAPAVTTRQELVDHLLSEHESAIYLTPETTDAQLAEAHDRHHASGSYLRGHEHEHQA